MRKEMSSPSGMLSVLKDSMTAFYENMVWGYERNSSIILNDNPLVSS